jgi:hypothetical protein
MIGEVVRGLRVLQTRARVAARGEAVARAEPGRVAVLLRSGRSAGPSTTESHIHSGLPATQPDLLPPVPPWRQH